MDEAFEEWLTENKATFGLSGVRNVEGFIVTNRKDACAIFAAGYSVGVTRGWEMAKENWGG